MTKVAPAIESDHLFREACSNSGDAGDPDVRSGASQLEAALDARRSQ
jgi:hypothetical protein